MPPIIPLQGTAQVAFTPGDDASGLIIKAIEQARHNVLVQAYSFTHRAIAEALVNAHRRGVDVQVIADPDQAERLETSLIDFLRDHSVPLYLDGQHAAAHEKVMLIDTGTSYASVITGSFNFTHAAQFRNSENLLILKGNAALTAAYAENWHRHRAHSLAIRK